MNQKPKTLRCKGCGKIIDAPAQYLGEKGGICRPCYVVENRARVEEYLKEPKLIGKADG